MTLEFRVSRSDHSPGRELLAELGALLDHQYPGGGRAVAIGGLRALTEDVCELKRLYVVPAARSRGVGRALLEALEAAARELGYARVRLDAGAEQRHSRALFTDAGYRAVPPYNGNHIAVFFGEKDLGEAVPPVRRRRSGR